MSVTTVRRAESLRMDETFSLGMWLRQRRRQLDLTQAELGRRAGVSAATVRKIEADERRPSVRAASTLAAALGLPASVQQMFVQVARGDRSANRIATLRDLLRPASLHIASTAIDDRSSRESLPLLEPLTRTIKPASLGHAFPFVGRTKELGEISARLEDHACRLLTVRRPRHGCPRQPSD